MSIVQGSFKDLEKPQVKPLEITKVEETVTKPNSECSGQCGVSTSESPSYFIEISICRRARSSPEAGGGKKENLGSVMLTCLLCSHRLVRMGSIWVKH